MSSGGASRFKNGVLLYPTPAGSQYVRIHRKTHGPIFFGPPAGVPAQNRFDAPGGEFRILYGAEQLSGAYVETVLRRPGRVLRRAEVDDRAWSRLETRRPLRLAKVFDEGLQWHGIDVSLISVDDYAASRALALDFHGADASLDGLAYRSRYNNGEVCVALFDRVAVDDLALVQTVGLDRITADVDALMALYGASFDTSALP